MWLAFSRLFVLIRDLQALFFCVFAFSQWYRPTFPVDKILISFTREEGMPLGQEERRVCAGETYGLLTAVEPDPEKHKSPQWLCRCQCGAMTSVQESHLLSGHTKSCGCLSRKNRPISIGDTFGMLTVEGPDPEKHRSRQWLCRCQCGTLKSVQESHLLSGHTKSCGCLRQQTGSKRTLNLTGKRFGRLVALEPTEKRRKTSVIWRCRCDCGNEVECETEDLTRGKVRSCGCLQADQRKKNMAAAIHFVDGTCVEKIACQKETAANTSGHRGVSRRSNGTWRACMDFRGKRYDLGTYQTFDDAVAARLEGEKMYQRFLEAYYAGQHKPELRE